MPETLEGDGEKNAEWHSMSLEDAGDLANKMRAKTGQEPYKPGVVHPTDRDKILSDEYKRNALFGNQYRADQNAEAGFKARRKESSSIYHESKATSVDYQNAFDEIEELQVMADTDMPAAKVALRGLLKGGRATWHGINEVFNVLFPSTNDVEELDYRQFKERMKTAKEQLQDLEQKAKKFER
jgi:hypothetical protein